MICGSTNSSLGSTVRQKSFLLNSQLFSVRYDQIYCHSTAGLCLVLFYFSQLFFPLPQLTWSAVFSWPCHQWGHKSAFFSSCPMTVKTLNQKRSKDICPKVCWIVWILGSRQVTVKKYIAKYRFWPVLKRVALWHRRNDRGCKPFESGWSTLLNGSSKS